MLAFPSKARRVVALFGTGLVVIVRFWVDAIANRAVESRWPWAPVAIAGILGVMAAAFAIFVSVTPYARKSAVPRARWWAAAVMLFALAFLASRSKDLASGYIVGGALLAGALSAWRAERLERAAAAADTLADV